MSREKGRDIMVQDKSTQKTNIFWSKVSDSKFIVEELLPLIKHLERVKDWDATIAIIKVPQLESEIKSLKDILVQKNKRITELERDHK